MYSTVWGANKKPWLRPVLLQYVKYMVLWGCKTKNLHSSFLHCLFPFRLKNRYVPMHHMVGNHSVYGNLCRGKRELKKKKSYDSPQIFDLKNEQDIKIFLEVQKVYKLFTTDGKLFEMLHTYTNQLKKVPNTKLLEIMPTHKNCIHTKSLDYRFSMVVSHHNIGMNHFYLSAFK